MCMCARARAGWSRSARDGDACGASLGPLRCAAQSWTGVLGAPVSPTNTRGRQSGRGPGDAQPRKKPGGAGPSPPAPASFSSLFLCFLLPLFSPPLLPLVVPGLLLSPPSSTHSRFPAHAFLFLGWKLCPGGTGHGRHPHASLLSRYRGSFLSSYLDPPTFRGLLAFYQPPTRLTFHLTKMSF